MESSQDLSNSEANLHWRKDKIMEPCCSSTTVSSEANDQSSAGGYRQRSTRAVVGGGKDVIFWKWRGVPFAIIIVATIAWLLFERSGLSFVSVCSDVLLVLVVVLFIRANGAVLLNKQLQPLPELVLSEDMVNNAAAFFRVKINYMCLMAHDITLGKDFKIFFKVVFCLWLLSILGGSFSFFTLAYIGTIFAVTIPALYSKYEDHVGRYAGMVHREILKHYRKVDESIISRLPRSLSKHKVT
ncbi:reticulon-like protein B16 isoform X2 [Nymphaea colorata]|uniref:reticulon-like protein B16 isoform X2 n=1 Tax=Nymphaea colorata TaxID=210225 RepID=UPI00129E0425|nr:reticulon-like protein B16 isoform X2 [Nymphaea colorata]